MRRDTIKEVIYYNIQKSLSIIFMRCESHSVYFSLVLVLYSMRPRELRPHDLEAHFAGVHIQPHKFGLRLLRRQFIMPKTLENKKNLVN